MNRASDPTKLLCTGGARTSTGVEHLNQWVLPAEVQSSVHTGFSAHRKGLLAQFLTSTSAQQP